MTETPKSDRPLPRNLYRRPGVSTYSARVRIPSGTDLKGSHLVRALNTSSLQEAQRRLPVVVAQLKLEIVRARRKPGVAEGSVGGLVGASIIEKADWWTQHIRAMGHDPRLGVPDALEPSWSAALDEVLGEPVGEQRQEQGQPVPLYAPGREEAALRLSGLVGGQIQPVGGELARYLQERELRSSYESRTRLAVRRLEAWLATRPSGDNVSAVTRREAGRFVDHLSSQDISKDTVNSQVSALLNYWSWMDDRNEIGENPWLRQQRSGGDKARNARKRSFTDAEVTALLSGPTYLTLHDMMRVAALSGMRLNEIARLTVGDVAGDMISVKEAKTSAGVRMIPVHPQLASLFSRRQSGKASEAQVFEELKASPSRPERASGKVGERFTDYRRDLNLDERLDGRRQANADFHSFRRWTITQLERANVAPQIIAALVGHEEGRQFLALIRYSAGPSMEQLRDAIGLIRLPDGVPVESPQGPKMGERQHQRQPKLEIE